MKQTLTQLFRYAIVGIASNALGYVFYLGLTHLGVGPKIAMSLLYGFGVMQTFFFNKRWTFGHTGSHGPVFVRYCIVYGLGYVMNFFALLVFVDCFGLPHQIVQGAMIIVVAVMLFTAHRYWVFAEMQKTGAA